MLPVDEVSLLEGQHVEEGAEVAAVVDLVADEGTPLLALGLRDAVRYHPRHRRVGVTFEKVFFSILFLQVKFPTDSDGFLAYRP